LVYAALGRAAGTGTGGNPLLIDPTGALDGPSFHEPAAESGSRDITSFIL